MSNFTLFFNGFTKDQWGKDPFLVPYNLGKELGCEEVNIVRFPSGDENDSINEHDGVRLITLPKTHKNATKPTIRLIPYFKYLWRNARNIDYLMLFFNSIESRMLAVLYKTLNTHGKCYIKMDINPRKVNDVPNTTKGPRGLKNKWIDELGKRNVDVISCESKIAFDALRNSKKRWNRWGKKLIYMPNGFDETLCQKLQIKEKSFSEKENLMITVGRLGTPPKNTSMLLNALGKVDMKDWRAVLIGPIQNSFKPIIEKFYADHPDKGDKIIFTGPIYDKKELWEWYNRSKVFLLSSKWESFALVFVESQRFSNFIISTRVGAAEDVVDGDKYGRIVPIDDIEAMSSEMQKIIDGETNIDVFQNFDKQSLSWEHRIKVVAEKLRKS